MAKIETQLLSHIVEQQKLKNNSSAKINLQSKNDSIKLSTKDETKTADKNVWKPIAIGISVAVAAAGIFFAIRSGKNIKLSNIEFDKGIAYLQNKTKFTGIIQDSLSNGDKILMEYKDGVIQKATRSGNINFEKIYKIVNGEKIVKTTTDNVTGEVNITKIQTAVKKEQEKLRQLLLDNSKLTSEEFSTQINEIKYKSKNQKENIDKIIESKKEAEKIAKEKIEKEMQEKINAENKIKKEALKAQETQQKILAAKLETKTNIEKFTGTDISDELCDYITQSKSNDEFDFNFVGNYLSSPDLYNREIYSLYKHISTVLKKQTAKTPLEAEKINIILLNIGEKSKNFSSDLLSKWNILSNLQVLYDKNPTVQFTNKTQLSKQYNDMTKQWLVRLQDISLSHEEQNLLMNNLLSFKRGVGNYHNPSNIAHADFIDALLSVGYQNKSLKQRFDNIALQYAKKISPSYEKATKSALENTAGFEGPHIDLLYRRGDNLIPRKATKPYDEKTADFIWNSYINCGDDTFYGAYFLNDTLRNADTKLRPDVLEVVSKLDDLIRSSEKLDNNYVVYRAIGLNNNSPLLAPWKKVGNVVTDKGFVSTTPVRGTYLDMFGKRQGTSYRMRIKLPKGTQGINMYNMPPLADGKNQEFLLPRNSSFKVTAVDEATKIIDLDYILPKQ